MRKSHALWGALLIFIGIIWILESTNTVSINLLGSFSRLWPILIIAAGITLFLKKESHWPRVILWVLVFAIIGGYALYLGYSDREAAGDGRTFDMVDGMKSGKLQVNVMAANLEIGPADEVLARVDSDIKNLSYNFTGGKNSTIQYYQKVRIGSQRGRNFKASLSKDISWNLELNTGATDGSIDFSDIILENCEINAAACDLDIIAGNRQDRARIRVNAVSADLDITIPEDTGIRVEANNLASDVRGDGIVKKDGRRYESTNYNTAEKQIIVELNSMRADVAVKVK